MRPLKAASVVRGARGDVATGRSGPTPGSGQLIASDLRLAEAADEIAVGDDQAEEEADPAATARSIPAVRSVAVNATRSPSALGMPCCLIPRFASRKANAPDQNCKIGTNCVRATNQPPGMTTEARRGCLRQLSWPRSQTRPIPTTIPTRPLNGVQRQPR